MKEFCKQKFDVLKKYPCILLFFGVVFGFFVLDMLNPDRESSALENKSLQQRPTFSMSSLLSNEWTAKYNDYVKDQVVLRDGWIGMQSRFERLLFHKVELGDILIGSNGQMFTKQFVLTAREESQLPNNVSAVTQFAQRHPGQVTLLLAPSASVIYPEELPLAAPMLDENSLLDDAFAQVGEAATVLDLRETFTREKEQYLYYRTDHHWTTNGAYLAYQAFCETQGLTPFDREQAQAVEVTGFRGTHYSASRLYDAVPDTITYYQLPNQETVYRILGENDFEVSSVGDLYDYDTFETNDKYGAFLRGNNGYSTIEGDGKGSILVVKDSYANCFVPFLTANYEKIGVVDFRYFSYGIDSLMEAEGYDQVLILYNFSSFKSDAKLPYLNRNATA